ncbi:Panacea domain-containing protein [Phyllobacterium leguminum]|uniref:Putative phage-associated protein n=1 Tax=Phyllobacterium leguminum TaxID=314237 RepID=A0A318TAY3_9HYPH|nr:type II toxin-antitoxin system antitoxin SocA domain-containing protein [Phyllobacterium leguminum]PYE88051.1 putative phage-associated protein [Phyllobacterium leguminum]
MVDIAAEGARTTAAAVANAFLDIQASDNSNFPLIDQMKLQKLVFYAHAWWLAHTGSPLFGDDVEAWPWGPVVGDVYGSFKEFGREPIRGKKARILVKTGDGPFNVRFEIPEPPDNDVLAFLRNVWETHKGMTGIQLSNSTHAPGEPWTIVKENYGSLDAKPRIPNTLIRDVFRNKLRAA